MEYGFNDFSISTGENLAEDGAGNLDVKNVAVLAAQASWLEPGGVGVDAYPGFDQIKKPVPNVLGFGFTAKLSRSRHRHEMNSSNSIFPQVCITCEKSIQP